MRKAFALSLLFVLSLIAAPQSAFANGEDPKPATTTPANPEVPERVQKLLERVEEIRAMDKSELSRAERKALRKELRTINAELRSTGNGIYLSVGAIIIIILLLILIL